MARPGESQARKRPQRRRSHQTNRAKHAQSDGRRRANTLSHRPARQHDASTPFGSYARGSGYHCGVYLHRDPGAYIHGEKTELIKRVEGKARLKPPGQCPARRRLLDDASFVRSYALRFCPNPANHSTSPRQIVGTTETVVWPLSRPTLAGNGGHLGAGAPEQDL